MLNTSTAALGLVRFSVVTKVCAITELKKQQLLHHKTENVKSDHSHLQLLLVFLGIQLCNSMHQFTMILHVHGEVIWILQKNTEPMVGTVIREKYSSTSHTISSKHHTCNICTIEMSYNSSYQVLALWSADKAFFSTSISVSCTLVQ